MIIKLTEKGVFYNQYEFIDWKNTNFPPKDTFGIKDRYEIVWEMKQLSFEKSKGVLSFEPIKYEVFENDMFNLQKPKYPLRRFEFQKINWYELEKYLYQYQPNLFEGLIYKPEVIDTSQIDEQIIQFDTSLVGKHEFKYKVRLKNTTFKYGYVEFEKEFKELGLRETIKIENSFILPEFEFIKPFFYKVFNKKTINVNGYIEYTATGGVNVEFTSKEISSINEEFIDNVRSFMVKDSLKRNQIVSVDKSLFTSDDFFEGLHEEKFSDNISPTEKELLKILLDSKGIRNRRQLEYLAGKVQTRGEKIRFTLNPDFGFLFFHKGDYNSHFIWELINSHATYIWTFDSSISFKNSLKTVEEIISFIRKKGRMAYMNNADETFNRIIHKGTTLKDAFPRWRHELKSLLT